MKKRVNYLWAFASEWLNVPVDDLKAKRDGSSVMAAKVFVFYQLFFDYEMTATEASFWAKGTRATLYRKALRVKDGRGLASKIIEDFKNEGAKT